MFTDLIIMTLRTQREGKNLVIPELHIAVESGHSLDLLTLSLVLLALHQKRVSFLKMFFGKATLPSLYFWLFLCNRYWLRKT